MLLEKVEDRSAIVGILGLGYVGLPLAAAFVDAGFHVLGFDTDQRKIDALGRGENYLKHLGQEMTQRMKESGLFEATSDFDRLAEPDAVLLCVPTPLGEHNEPDLSFVENSTRDVAKRLRKGQLVVLESTTYPGTTRDLMGDILEETGLKAGQDFLLAYSPEREDPGRQGVTTSSIPKLVGGTCETSGKIAYELYEAAIASVYHVTTAEVAEAAKLTENIFRAVNIALVNELKVIYDAMGIDVWEVIEAAATKPFGFMKFTPGPGLGGHCIPIDPFYLTWVARKIGRPTKFIELAGEINTDMPRYVVQQTMLALNSAGEGAQERQDPGPRSRVQARRRRHPRVAGHSAPGAAARARGRGPLLRPARAGGPQDARAGPLGGVLAGSHAGVPRRAGRRRGRHGPQGVRLGPDRRERADSSSTRGTPWPPAWRGSPTTSRRRAAGPGASPPAHARARRRVAPTRGAGAIGGSRDGPDDDAHGPRRACGSGSCRSSGTAAAWPRSPQKTSS